MGYYYKVEMGTAVVGGPTIGMQSTGLYNCLTVAAVSKTRQIGGLYHYPSQCRGKDYVILTMTRMINHVMPDWIGITPAARVYPGDVGSDPEDVAWLRETCGNLAGHITIEVLPEKSVPTLFWVDNKPVVNVLPDGAPTLLTPQMSAIPGVITSRPLNGDARVFGFDCENQNPEKFANIVLPHLKY